MATRKLDKTEWASYFDQVSGTLGGRQDAIEVASLELGDQIATDGVALKGLTYDPKADTLEVFTESLDHRIAHPREIYVAESAGGLESVEAVAEDDTKQIIRLKEPLRLPG